MPIRKFNACAHLKYCMATVESCATYEMYVVNVRPTSTHHGSWRKAWLRALEIWAYLRPIPDGERLERPTTWATGRIRHSHRPMIDRFRRQPLTSHSYVVKIFIKIKAGTLGSGHEPGLRIPLIHSPIFAFSLLHKQGKL
jgi:hypothetical protein